MLGVGGRITDGAGQVSLNTQALFPQPASASGVEDRYGFSGNWSVTTYAVCATLNGVFDSQVVSVQTAADTSSRKIFTIDSPAGMNLTGERGVRGNTRRRRRGGVAEHHPGPGDRPL